MEKIAVREFRGLAPHYLRGTAGAAKVRGGSLTLPSLLLRLKKSLRLCDNSISDKNLTSLVGFYFTLFFTCIDDSALPIFFLALPLQNLCIFRYN